MSKRVLSVNLSDRWALDLWAEPPNWDYGRGTVTWRNKYHTDLVTYRRILWFESRLGHFEWLDRVSVKRAKLPREIARAAKKAVTDYWQSQADSEQLKGSTARRHLWEF